MNAAGSKGQDKQLWILGLVLCGLFFSFFISCNQRHKSPRAKKILLSNPSAQDFADELQTIYKPVDTSNRKNISSVSDNIRYAYQLNEYLPFWISNNKPDKEVATFLQDLENTRWDGLDPERYHLSALKTLNEKLTAAKSNDVTSLIAFDTLLTRSYISAAHDLLLGEVLPSQADSLWYIKNDSVCRAPELLVNNEHYVSLDTFRSRLPTYKLLRKQYRLYMELSKDEVLLAATKQLRQTKEYTKPDSAERTAINTIITMELPWLETDSTPGSLGRLLSSYQFYAGLRPTGKTDSTTLAYLSMRPQDIANTLKANMERIRWMQQSFADIYVLVNVPLMEFFLRRDGQDAMHMRVVVGKPIRQTPSLSANMANVVINPPWGVPPTILKKDVLPGITRSGKKYLEEKGLVPYDHKGKRVNPAIITVKNYARYVYKQDPGDDNSLGYVKFNLPNPWDIYLHDTPHRGDFVKRYRALSSGCIRLQEPKELALYILDQLEKKRYDSTRLDSIIKTHKTRWELLKNKIPVDIVYLTTFEDSTGVHLRRVNDIYKRDEKLISLLKRD